nr:diguanylate cyclase [Acidobacteriota bacterium]
MAYQMLDKPSVPEGETTQAQKPCSPGWAETQDALASAAGLSILLVEGHQPPSLHVSNNNSICRAFQSSSTHKHLCDPYCGRAHERARETEAATHYRCHAGLHCFTMPVEIGKSGNLAVIGGRAFLTTADYRALAERLRTGDLQDLLSSDLFRNVIFAARQDLDDLAKRIAAAAKYKTEAQSSSSSKAVRGAAAQQQQAASAHDVTASLVEGAEEPVETFGASGQLTDSAFQEACGNALRAFSEKQGLASMALLLREQNRLVTFYATGKFRSALINVELGPKDARLALTARAGSSILLSETPTGFKPVRTPAQQEKLNPKKTAELFPLVVGDEVKGGLLVRDASLNEERRLAITDFCRDIAMPLEVLRLRSELDQRARSADQLIRFTERTNVTNPAETYFSILRHSVELLHAERGSLFLFDAESNELAMKAAMGFDAGAVRLRLGDGISGAVLENGQPLVVRDLIQAGHTPAPAERRYKTKSFISYPILIGGRKVGVLNVTDKAGGGSYDEIDLSLLETIGPQMALALDRAEWHEKAEQFQLMSITDPLTGLLNRRYMEERLTEEMKRSSRHGYAMSFMMIDIDDFKVYNDRNGHQAGDLALEMTAQCLKSALRSADVASRYG